MKTTGETNNSPVPAAQYLREFSEHQQFCTANQSQGIALYAMDHNFEILQM
jgi:hypothetical protein